MPLDYDFLTGLVPLEVEHDFTVNDTILYALGIGAGLAATTDDDLRFVYESGLQALPTMAAVLAYPGFWARDPKYGITWQKLLHVEQSIEIHQPLPVEGRVRGEMTIDEIYDRGAEKGALMHFSRRIFDAAGILLATVRQVNLLRADGGFGGRAGAPPTPHAVPDRTPDATLALPTSLDQALIYRLSGDTNPLHADPAVAKAAGFDRPILHGLCSFGIAGRAALKVLCDNDPARLRRLDVRFSSPVFPGETIETRIWRTGEETAAIEAFALERGVAVMRNGLVEHAA
ncbi:MAG: MaoC/PaaZ C-terminal domain-containing protein [Rhizobiaceae bacterium]